MADRVHRADAIEAAAFRDIVAAAPPGLAKSVGLRALQIAGATLLIAPGIPDITFNRAIGLGMESPASETGLDAVIAAFRKSGSSKYWIHWNPAATPDSVPRWLESRGFTAPARKSWAKMARGIEAAPACDTTLEIRVARAGEEAGAAEAIRAAFGMPPPMAAWFAAIASRPNWTMYAALDDQRIVGGGLLYRNDDEAWLGAGGVLSEYRGRGAHRALMSERIDAAIAAGCKTIYTETGEAVGDEPNPSLANMRRCGFTQLCSRLNYAAPA